MSDWPFYDKVQAEITALRQQLDESRHDAEQAHGTAQALERLLTEARERSERAERVLDALVAQVIAPKWDDYERRWRSR